MTVLLFSQVFFHIETTIPIDSDGYSCKNVLPPPCFTVLRTANMSGLMFYIEISMIDCLRLHGTCLNWEVYLRVGTNRIRYFLCGLMVGMIACTWISENIRFCLLDMTKETPWFLLCQCWHLRWPSVVLWSKCIHAQTHADTDASLTTRMTVST